MWELRQNFLMGDSVSEAPRWYLEPLTDTDDEPISEKHVWAQLRLLASLTVLFTVFALYLLHPNLPVFVEEAAPTTVEAQALGDNEEQAVMTNDRDDTHGH